MKRKLPVKYRPAYEYIRSIDHPFTASELSKGMDIPASKTAPIVVTLHLLGYIKPIGRSTNNRMVWVAVE